MKRSITVLLLIGLAYSTSVTLHAASSGQAANNETGTIVLVFKDGHKQSYEASSLADVQYRSASGAITRLSLPSSFAPGRRTFLGSWIVGEGNGETFTIDLAENGQATKSLGAAHGTWVYVDGEARVSWDDGWHDVIRKTGKNYEKFAYEPGRSISDNPSNVTEARPKNPSPI